MPLDATTNDPELIATLRNEGIIPAMSYSNGPTAINPNYMPPKSSVLKSDDLWDAIVTYRLRHGC